ncbi:hypothetical protein CK203_114266 [Vitis vinifera]|uniref:Retrovirus-related Pol polyprotein from transposon 17.6 n=1 Tax=Vitis vinifera TaxID=29760 RepID=A0A438CBB7_VITVI|nr:hypothetical protein CK203_114266 [Vitis vinifera]
MQEVENEESPKLILKPLPAELKMEISDLKGINPLVCTHHIYMEEEVKPVHQPQRTLNPHLQKVVRAEVVAKKSRITVVQNDKGEEVSTRLTSSWKMATPGTFKLKLLLRTRKIPPLHAHSECMPTEECLLAYAMHPQTFQRCMLSIFNDMVERIMEVFMDDITKYGSTFEECLANLESVLSRCIEKNLVDFIVKLSSPTTVKGVTQFLGHAGFYRRFIKDFSKLAKPDAKVGLIGWILLLKEFNLHIKDKRGVENVVVDHLSRLAITHNIHCLPINEIFQGVAYANKNCSLIIREVSLSKSNRESSVIATKAYVEATLLHRR